MYMQVNEQVVLCVYKYTVSACSAQTHKVKAATAPCTHFTEETLSLSSDLQAKMSIFQHRNVGVIFF